MAKKQSLNKAVLALFKGADPESLALDLEQLIQANERIADALEQLAAERDTEETEVREEPRTAPNDPTMGFRNRVANVRREEPDMSLEDAVRYVRDRMQQEQDYAIHHGIVEPGAVWRDMERQRMQRADWAPTPPIPLVGVGPPYPWDFRPAAPPTGTIEAAAQIREQYEYIVDYRLDPMGVPANGPITPRESTARGMDDYRQRVEELARLYPPRAGVTGHRPP